MTTVRVILGSQVSQGRPRKKRGKPRPYNVKDYGPDLLSACNILAPRTERQGVNANTPGDQPSQEVNRGGLDTLPAAPVSE